MTSEEKAKLLAGMFQGATIENSQIIGIAESGSTIIYKKEGRDEEQLRFPLNSTKDEGVRLYDNLTNDSFMQVPLDSWLFLMGFVEQRPEHVVAIKWMGTKEQLRLMLRLLFESLLNNKVISVAMIERLTPMCFIDKNGKPLKLAKAREESSWRTDRLKEFFRPNPTSSETL